MLHMEMLKTIFAVLTVSAGMLSTGPSAAQQTDTNNNGDDTRTLALWRAASDNEKTTGFVISDVSYFQPIDLELADLVATKDDVRLVSILGRNHIQNVYDLLFLRGVDATPIRSDVLEFVNRRNDFPGIKRVVSSMARFHEEKVVFLSSNKYASVEELEGKTIAIGEVTSGEHVTGSLVLEMLGIGANLLHMSNGEAVEQLRAGDIDALVYLHSPQSHSAAGSDAAQAENPINSLNDSDPVNLLPVALNDELENVYTESQLTHDDLPNLVSENDATPTLSVQVILAAYRWNARNPRYQSAYSFVDSFVKNAQRLQRGPNQRYWSTLDFNFDVPGVAQLNIVEDVLENIDTEQNAALEEKRQQIDEQWTELDELLDERLNPTSETDVDALEQLIDQMSELFQALDTQSVASEGNSAK